MKETKKIHKNNFFKKTFIKLCRLLGYEIIDQSNFYVPTQKKSLTENLSIAGKNNVKISCIGKIIKEKGIHFDSHLDMKNMKKFDHFS